MSLFRRGLGAKGMLPLTRIVYPTVPTFQNNGYMPV